ncbi:MAG TPA: transglycosylase domain-containing protein [Burkholderiaceae bacterium]|nr:transglycosylase domain-containing protein [Burkholderiaceae bacterium]
MSGALRTLGRLTALLLLSALALQGYFFGRIALMTVVDPQSTTFQRSQAWQLVSEKHALAWRQQWVAYPRIAPALKRAVVAAEDAGFTEHGGVEWDAVQKAWDRNQKAEARFERVNATATAPVARRPAYGAGAARAPKVFGGSTITQQLAKNLFLDGERNLLRKAQELVITLMLEAVLGKQRIFEIYLNSVEWGEGVFGAQAAARHYFRVDAAALGASQAAQLAVMLPAPKRFEKRPSSPYVVGRAATVGARMAAVDVP